MTGRTIANRRVRLRALLGFDISKPDVRFTYLDWWRRFIGQDDVEVIRRDAATACVEAFA